MILKKKIFEWFSMYFYGSNLGPLWPDHLGPWGLDLNKFGKRSLGNATYQISSIWATWFWRTFLNIFMYFYEHISRTPGRGHLGPWDLCLNKFGTDFKHLSKAVLEKKIFKYTSFLNPRPPWYIPASLVKFHPLIQVILWAQEVGCRRQCQRDPHWN